MSSDTKSIAFSPNWQQSGPSVPEPAPAEADPRDGHQTTVIVADDDPISREMVSGLVQKWGFHVITAIDGREAMELLRAQTKPVLAILDWMMPGLDGTDVCRRVREVNRSVYIVLLTARTDKERIVEGLRAGADDYLTKPFNNAELHARLNVGARIIGLQATLAERVAELEKLVAENHELKLQLPL
jgi:DNA-binding response OmpR family regulator